MADSFAASALACKLLTILYHNILVYLSTCISPLGYYLYLESSHPSKAGEMAQLNSPLVPPAGQHGYCLTVWYHMFGATVGSLKVFVKTIETGTKTLVSLQITTWIPSALSLAV